MVSISSDPRFKLARTLVSSASSGSGGSGGVGTTNNNSEDDDEDSSPIATAIDIFASLLNECECENNTTNGDGDADADCGGDGDGKTSCNTALCQYEYANALFRASVLETPFDETEESGGVVEGDGDKKPPAAVAKSGEAMSQREVMAAAALKRSADAAATTSGVVGEEEEDSYSSSSKRSKLNDKDYGAAEKIAEEAAGLKTEEDGKNGEEIVKRGDESNQEEEEEDDLSLALEMMETSVGILLNYHYRDDDDDDANNGNDTKQKWLLDQLPRILICIGDLHSHRGEYGRAVDAYCRALAYRDKAWNAVKQRASSTQVTNGDKKSSKEALLTLEALQCQRKMVEINALIVEALLACPSGEDVVCPDEDDESKLNVLVSSKERISYAQSYFQEARLGNDDVLLRIGTMKKKKLGGDLREEKVDVACMLQMVVGVGRALSDVLET